MTIDDIARVCHEANRAYCFALGDIQMPTWGTAPEWMKTSAKKGVALYLSNPGITPADLHENWCKEKRAEGWAYGPEKQPALKLHPCLVPYANLPRVQQKKDELFMAVVYTLGMERKKRP